MNKDVDKLQELATLVLIMMWYLNVIFNEVGLVQENYNVFRVEECVHVTFFLI